MIRGLLASRNGMSYEQNRIDTISNNISNVNTNGFKRGVAAGREFAPLLQQRLGDVLRPSDQANAPVGPLGFGADVINVGTDQAAGSVVMTGLPLDFAIEGAGGFVLQTPAGPLTTRDGAFHQDATGRLVNADGYAVMVDGQPLVAPPGSISTGVDGAVSVNGRPAGRFDMPGATALTHIRSGWLETSNVQLSQEMPDLIEAAKSFAASQRALKLQDESLQSTISIGKL